MLLIVAATVNNMTDNDTNFTMCFTISISPKNLALGLHTLNKNN